MEFQAWVEEDAKWKQEVMEKIDKRDNLDSLYREHLQDCSFIDQASVKVDRRGYLYSNYHRHDGKGS